eukprot:3517234-Pyramimonas_sp.AAC.1
MRTWAGHKTAADVDGHGDTPQLSEKDQKEKAFWEELAKDDYAFECRGIAGNPAAGAWQRALKADPGLKADYNKCGE